MGIIHCLSKGVTMVVLKNLKENDLLKYTDGEGSTKIVAIVKVVGAYPNIALVDVVEILENDIADTALVVCRCRTP